MYSGLVQIINSDGDIVISSSYLDGKKDLNETNSRVDCETYLDVVWTEVCIGGDCSITELTITEYEVCANEDSGGGGAPWDPFGEGGGGSPKGKGPIGVPDFDYWSLEDESQGIGNLCDNINFKHVGNGFTAEINGLGISAINYMTNSVINVELGTNCIEIAEYYVGTSYDAAVIFVSIFNSARNAIASELNSGLLTPSQPSIRSRLIQLIVSELQTDHPGSSFGLGPCLGEVPKNIADYGC